MTDKSQRSEGRNGVLSSLGVAIDNLNLAKEVSSIAPAKAVFGSVVALLTTIRDTMIDERDYVELGLFCADICKALERGMNGKELSDLGQSVCDAMNQLTTTIAEIQQKVTKQNGQQSLHARDDKDTVMAWKSDLNRLLHIFNTELATNTHSIVAAMNQITLKSTDSQNRVVRNLDYQEIQRLTSASSAPRELPPPPTVFFGRDELTEKTIDFAQRLTPIALIGAGGIGKTSIVLTVLHNDRIKQRFGDNRWFVRCDQFPASHTHFLRHLSKVIGAGIENPEDLSPLRPFLSSKEMLIVLDNAESILDPLGTSAKEIYAIVDELSQFNNICLCITSRISAVPPRCQALHIPTLSAAAARDTFYRIYKHSEQADAINDILEKLDFHPLSITLLATVSQYNKWDANRLTREWEQKRTGVLHTQHSTSLAATIELSLASPMFQELGPDARGLLGVVAFFPQGVDEKNIGWLFPTISDGPNIFDTFCILSLTYRTNGFITMLAPLRDYLRPRDPKSSPLLIATKDCYFTRLAVSAHPEKPSHEESRWIMSEDVNVEHLLDVFTSIDANLENVWDACVYFMSHLYWHKPRLVMLGPKIEALPDDHPSKALCLQMLSSLIHSVGNHAERKRLLTRALKLWRERRSDTQVAQVLSDLSDTNREMGLKKEGIQQAKEASEIFERLGEAAGQAGCLIKLALLLHSDNQLDAAEKAASRAIDLLPEKGQQLRLCQGHRTLGTIYQFKGKKDQAIHHLEVALEIASPLNCDSELFWVHYSLADLFCGQGRLNDAHTHIERAKSHAINNAYLLARATVMQALFWGIQRMFEKARSEASRAIDVFEKLGAANDAEATREIFKISRIRNG